MINAIANISLNHIERASTDEFERDILTKASAITLTPITFLELIVAAILAWSLPGRLTLLALLAIIPSIAGTSLSAAWMRRHIAPHRPLQLDFDRPLPHPDVPLLRRHRLPRLRAFRCRRPPYLIGATVGAITSVLISPALRRKQNRRDQSRLDAELED